MPATRALHILSVGLRNLGRTRLRSSLTMLGVVFGVGSVIVMLAVGEGTRQKAIKQIESLGSQNIILRSVKPSTESWDASEGVVNPYGLTPRDHQALTDAVPTVVATAPLREHRRELRFGSRALEGRVVAVTPAYQELNGIRISRGRFISDLDGERSANVAVLAAETATTLFPKEDPLGRSIRIGTDQYYTVVGVAAHRADSEGVEGQLPPREFNRDVYIPFRTDRTRFGQYLTYLRGGSLQKDGAEISQITVTVAETKYVKDVAEVVAELIDRSHTQEDVAIAVPLALLEKIEETQGLFNLVLGAIASISLLVGGIGIMNIMLATVSERTREIGIRRALGAKQRDISRQFLVETVVLSGLGGLLGILLGLGLSFGVTHFLGVYTLVRPASIVLASVISVAVGLIFGMYPARRAARMDPIEALRRD